MGKHSCDRDPQKADSDLVIYHLAKIIDSCRAQQYPDWVRTEEEAEKDILEIIEDAWGEVSGSG